MTTILANHIDGRAAEPIDGTYLHDIDPATGAVHALVPASEAADVDLAVAAGTRAFPGWSSTPAAERSRIMLRIADALESRLEDFVRAESIDSGKPVRLARALDIPRAVANLRFFATAILHTGSDLFPTDDRALLRHKARHEGKGNGFGYGLAEVGSVTRTLSARYYKDGAEILVPMPDRSEPPRRLTPRECARLMGFTIEHLGREFVIPDAVSDAQAYRQFGNSVVVPQFKWVASLITYHAEAVFAGRMEAAAVG